MTARVYLPIYLGILMFANLGSRATATVQSSGIVNDAQTSIGYDPATGEVYIDSPNVANLTSFRVESAASVFTGAMAENLLLPPQGFDRDENNVIFKSTIGGSFGSLSFGKVAQIGLSEAFLLHDWSVTGSLEGGGGLGEVDLIYGAPIPEPSSLALATLLLRGLAVCSRRRCDQKRTG